MLCHLEIRDLLIIDHLVLEFQPGLNVLTGETGAGKSILLDALGFVLGWRGRAELVRAGADQGEVIAEFALSDGHPALAVLDDAGLPVDDTLILRRINKADGRKTAWVNDRRVSGEVLRNLSECLLELHGQHDDRGLLDARGHRALLDAFGGFAPYLDATRDAWRGLSQAQKALDAALAALATAREEEDFLRHAMGELDALDPQPGEDAELDARRRMMQGAERIREDISRAFGAMGGDGAEGRLSDALRWLEGATDGAEGQLDSAIDALGRALAELGEAQQGVETCLQALDFNPAELEHLEERLFAIRGLARKHGVQPDDLGTLAIEMRGKLDALDAGEGDIAALELAVKEARAAYQRTADDLSGRRAEAAARLDQAMATELAPLKMERAVFTTEITSVAPGPDGQDAVSFTVATNPGAPAGPLNKIASGGELSRFLLALKVCLRGEDGSKTLIFDEIDRGVGGATADAVGRRLKALAEGGQVLVVTHSPQVAAQGAHHWQVAKTVVDGMTLSRVVPLTADDRTDEIARMLSGDTITPEARAAAQSLLAG
ncbi:DNA repair protein RecN [Actibacterium atlanticum]|uniref:DNA repair protein RecN n=1 Tax=Actibacterium atlanticum TaxID=1461693 RepID=A0A058ZNH6_9RHOB|nr:DNA repair protein RecN [Actibacterium atlanticum]KCV83118.1 DNA repair protein RecN [Actibacterium atlanticum]